MVMPCKFCANLDLRSCRSELFDCIQVNWAALYAPVVFLIWRNTLEAFLRNIKDLFVKKIKEIVKICTSIFFFAKRWYALSRLEPCHIFLVTEKKYN